MRRLIAFSAIAENDSVADGYVFFWNSTRIRTRIRISLQAGFPAGPRLFADLKPSGKYELRLELPRFVETDFASCFGIFTTRITTDTWSRNSNGSSLRRALTLIR